MEEDEKLMERKLKQSENDIKDMLAGNEFVEQW